MIANHPTYKETLVPHLVATLIYLSQNYSYYIRGNRSPLTFSNIFLSMLHSLTMQHNLYDKKYMRRYDITWCYLKDPFNLMCYSNTAIFK